MVRVVMNNLSSHTAGALDEALSASETSCASQPASNPSKSLCNVNSDHGARTMAPELQPGGECRNTSRTADEIAFASIPP